MQTPVQQRGQQLGWSISAAHGQAAACLQLLGLDTRLITQTGEGVHHLGRHMLTKQPFLISAGKAVILSLPFSHTDYCESPLVGFSMAHPDKNVLRQSDWQMNDRCHSDVIHLHYLPSLFSFSYHAICRFLNKRTSLVLNYSFSPVSSPVPCTSAFCISRDTSCELALSSEHPITSLPSLVTFYYNFQPLKGLAKNCGNVWIEIALVRGAPKCCCDTVS